jgi:hypothetical protein
VKLELAWRAEEYTVDRCLRYLDSAIPVARAGSDEGLTAVWKVVASPYRMFNMNVVHIGAVGAAYRRMWWLQACHASASSHYSAI